ncbi:hypothetical protein ACFLZC_01980 [Patescibacteria group bacterium]
MEKGGAGMDRLQKVFWGSFTFVCLFLGFVDFNMHLFKGHMYLVTAVVVTCLTLCVSSLLIMIGERITKWRKIARRGKGEGQSDGNDSD